MNEIPQLIEKAQKNDAEAQTAVTRLVAIGISVVPAIVDAIRKSSDDSSSSLKDVLLQIRDPEIVSVFLELIHEDNIDLVMAALQGLGQSKDKRALQPLLDYLMDSQNLETYRSLAARAIGELGYTEAISTLLKVTDEAMKDDMLKLAISTIIALAKLGNHDKASIAISLTKYKRDPIIRANAVESLQYTVGVGMFPALQAALRDSYFEVRMKAVDAMFYLGVKDAIDDLILRVKDKNKSVATNALVRLQDLTGEVFEDDIQVKTLQKWWKNHKEGFNAAICYRLGKPIWLPNVITFLEEPNMRNQIIKELQIITGKDFGFNPFVSARVQSDLLSRAQSWWENEGHHRFEAGHLYKYGYEQNILSIF